MVKIHNVIITIRIIRRLTVHKSYNCQMEFMVEWKCSAMTLVKALKTVAHQVTMYCY